MTKRIRRSAEEARELILEAAGRHLVEVGPAGIRLQEVAADVGVSHSTLLHHFGSREELVTAVCARVAHSLGDEIVEAVASAPLEGRPMRAMLDRVAEVFGAGGHARVLAWLALSGTPPRAPQLAKIAAVAHARRVAVRAEGDAPSEEDTYFVLLLATCALFGDALAGHVFRGEAPGDAAERSSARFREWLGGLLAERFEGGGRTSGKL